MPEAFDIESITLGEMLAVERASGEEFNDLAQSKIGLLMIVLYLRLWRQQGSAPLWSEIASRRVSDKFNLVSPSSQD